MAHTVSARKRIRQDENHRRRNREMKSRLKTAARRFEQAVRAEDAAAAEKCFRTTTSLLDKAARKGIIHRRKADRRKARCARTLSGLKGASTGAKA